MPHLNFSRQPQGWLLAVTIGVTGQEAASLVASGQPVPRSQVVRAAIDTGTDVSAVDPAVLGRLGLAAFQQTSTQTVAGSVHVDLHRVSLSITPAGRLTSALLVQDQLVVIALPTLIPGIEVLLGRDVIDQSLLVLNGPLGEGTIAD
jgi:hypothetical protein